MVRSLLIHPLNSEYSTERSAQPLRYTLTIYNVILTDSKRKGSLTLICSTELHRTGSVKSSSAFSNQLMNSDAFFANRRNRSSTYSEKNSNNISGQNREKTV